MIDFALDLKYDVIVVANLFDDTQTEPESGHGAFFTVIGVEDPLGMGDAVSLVLDDKSGAFECEQDGIVVFVVFERVGDEIVEHSGDHHSVGIDEDIVLTLEPDERGTLFDYFAESAEREFLIMIVRFGVGDGAPELLFE